MDKEYVVGAFVLAIGAAVAWDWWRSRRRDRAAATPGQQARAGLGAGVAGAATGAIGASTPDGAAGGDGCDGGTGGDGAC